MARRRQSGSRRQRSGLNLFAAIFHFDGRPIDPSTLSGAGGVVESPQGAPHIAFVHSSPGPSVASGEWRGVESLRDRYWIAGRLRLDGRAELCRRLGDHLRDRDVSDATLCLHAFAAWGESFAQRLSGDFCFVLWDRESRRLLALRDQLGVRALFHAEAKGACYLSDSLDWVLAMAPVGRTLDERWIADFLGIGHALDVDRTVYRQISRLAPAHLLEASDAGIAVRRYWRLELDEPLYLGNRRDYGERFREVLSLAIADRLPPGRVGISMSGGLDSTTLAAGAVEVTGDPSRVVAECEYFERQMPDDERPFATLAARYLGIELELRAVDGLAYDRDWRARAPRSAEPHFGVTSAQAERRMALAKAGRAAVWFHGEGPDNALTFERNAYFSWLKERHDWRRLGGAALHYLTAKAHEGWRGWQESLQRHVVRPALAPPVIDVPPWLDRGLVERHHLGDRLRPIGRPGEGSHPWHPKAVASFSDAIWPALFASFDVEETLAPLVWRHPYLDLRVLHFLLSVPPVPWARRKLVMREAMRGRLPASVLRRPKTPLAASPSEGPIAAFGLPELSCRPRLAQFVDLAALPGILPGGADLDRLVAVHVLDRWLEQQG